jgi:hypothetical protein
MVGPFRATMPICSCGRWFFGVAHAKAPGGKAPYPSPCGPGGFWNSSRPSRTSKVRRREIGFANLSPFSQAVPSRGSTAKDTRSEAILFRQTHRAPVLLFVGPALYTASQGDASLIRPATEKSEPSCPTEKDSLSCIKLVWREEHINRPAGLLVADHEKDWVNCRWLEPL